MKHKKLKIKKKQYDICNIKTNKTMYRNVEQYNITDIFLGCLLVVGKGAIPGGLVSFGFGV